MDDVTKDKATEAAAEPIPAGEEALSEMVGALDGAKLDRENMVLRNVVILGYDSRNEREYTPKAGASVARLAENTCAYIDHREPGSRSVKELLGVYRNCTNYPHQRKVRGDLHYMANHSPLIEFLVDKQARGVGNSINGRGVFGGHGTGGKRLVEDYTGHYSVDLVVNPGTVNGVWESTCEPQRAPVATTERSPSVDEKALMEQIGKLQTEAQALREAVQGEQKARQAAEAKAAKQSMVQEAIDESKKTVPAVIRKHLALCESKQEMAELIAAFVPASVKVQESAPISDKAAQPLQEQAATLDPAKIAVELSEAVNVQDQPAGYRIAGVRK
jgi:hypothetical protein